MARSRAAFGFGFGGEGVFGPGVFGVASAKVFADIEIGGFPEAGQVGGDLDRAVVGAEQVHQQADPAGGDERRLLPAEDFLKPHGQGGLSVPIILNADVAAGRDGDGFGGELIQKAQLVVVDVGADQAGEVLLFELVDGAFAGAALGENLAQAGVVEKGPGLFRNVFADEGEAFEQFGGRLVGGENGGGLVLGDLGEGVGDILRAGVGILDLAQGQVHETGGDGGVDFAGGGVALHLAGGAEQMGKEFFEPGGFDLADEPGEGFAGAAAGVVAGVDGDEEWGVDDDGGGVHLDAKPADHGGGIGVVVAAATDAVGVGQEDQLEQVILVGRGVGAGFEPARVTQQIVAGAGDLSGGGGVDLLVAEAMGKVGLFGHLQEPKAMEDIRAAMRLAGDGLTEIGGVEQHVFFGKDGGDGGGGFEQAGVGGGDHDAGQSRMGGDEQHLPAQRGDVVVFEGSQQGERALCGCDGMFGWNLEPAEAARVGFAPFVQVKNGRAKVHPLDFRQLERLAVFVFGGGPESDASAGRGSAGAAHALGGVGAADVAQFEAIHSALGVVNQDAGQAGIDHGADAVDGQRGLGDVGGEDDFSLGELVQHARLGVKRERTMEGEDGQIARLGEAFQSGGSAADFVHARQEDQNVAGVVRGFVKQIADLAGDVLGQDMAGGRRRGRGESKLDGEHPAGHVEGGAVAQKRGDGLGVERRGHDQDVQVIAHGGGDFAKHGDAEIAVDVTFVKFVEDDAADAFEEGVLDELSGEDAFGEDLQGRVFGEAFFAADLIADLVAQLPVVFKGDAVGGRAGGDAAGLEHDDAIIGALEHAGLEDGRSDAGGLAGARFGDDDQAAMLAEGLGDLRKEWIDGQWNHGRAPTRGSGKSASFGERLVTRGDAERTRMEPWGFEP